MNAQRQLVEMLPAKQKMLDFGTPSIWQQLSAAQRQDCKSAIAELIFKVTQIEIEECHPKPEEQQ